MTLEVGAPDAREGQPPRTSGEVLRRSRLPVLAGFRAIAVMVVIGDHAGVVATLGARPMYGSGVGGNYIYRAFDTRLDTLAMGCLLALMSGVSSSSGPRPRLRWPPLSPTI
jgi:hypothetical protein